VGVGRSEKAMEGESWVWGDLKGGWLFSCAGPCGPVKWRTCEN
jgi:hypothetical protein